MRKFTAFTILLTIIVIVVLAEMLVNNYLPSLGGESSDTSDEISFDIPESLNGSNSLKASVLDSDGKNRLGADAEVVESPEVVTEENAFSDSEFMDLSQLSDEYLPVVEDEEGSLFQTDEVLGGDGNAENVESVAEVTDDFAQDFEDTSYVSLNSAFIRDEQIKSAGFIGAHLEEEEHNNSLFKTISIEDLYDTEISKMAVKTDTVLMAKIYVFKVGIQADVSEVYQLLKLRASESSGAVVNETNQYGAASFYMNDPARNNTAFLTVRIGGLVYAFSYPKEYHAQVKNLIKLLEWEIS